MSKIVVVNRLTGELFTPKSGSRCYGQKTGEYQLYFNDSGEFEGVVVNNKLTKEENVKLWSDFMHKTGFFDQTYDAGKIEDYDMAKIVMPYDHKLYVVVHVCYTADMYNKTILNNVDENGNVLFLSRPTIRNYNKSRAMFTMNYRLSVDEIKSEDWNYTNENSGIVKNELLHEMPDVCGENETNLSWSHFWDNQDYYYV